MTRYADPSRCPGAEIQRLEKVLQDAGDKLTSVVRRSFPSRAAMVEALIAGERDSARLAEMAKGRMRPKIRP